jgi:tetratricopeptide (TPR) repeat protein
MIPSHVLSLLTATLPAAVAAQESVDALIQRGREQLAAGKLAEAQARFDQAATLDGSTPKTRVWVVRGWIANGKLDDAMQGADELVSQKAPAADTDYLFGLTFLALAKQSIAANGGGNFTQSQLEDSYTHLKRALKADAERYRDAWLSLAEAAWYAQDLAAAREAGEKAIGVEPRNPDAFAMLGRVAFSQYIAETDEAKKEEHWKAALAAFTKTVSLHGEPDDPWKRSALAEAHDQCGNLHGWKADKTAAAASYSAGIGWDPSRVNFAQVHTLLGAEEFLACVLEGSARFQRRHPDGDPLFATVAWWTGFAQFENARWADAESSFRAAVKLWPSFANSWYYVFRSAFSQQRYPDALEALHTYAEAQPVEIAGTLAGDFARNLSVLGYLIGWCADPEKQGGEPRNADAAFLCELLTRLEPAVPRHWNNLGLFLRDQGDQMQRKSRPSDPKARAELYERSLEAYSKALELSPEDPNYLNDTAVVLHYNLKREFERVQQLYEKAAKRAAEELARKDLSPDDRAVIETAKRDSNDNLRRLKKFLEKRAAGEDVDPNSVR